MMKVLHINAGLENGGGLSHIVNLLTEAKLENQDWELLTLAQGPVSETAEKKGIKTHILNASSRYDLASLKKLTKFINDGNYDIVHTHGARANLYISLIKNKIKAKWCITVHSDPYLDFENRGIIGKIFTDLNIHALRKADCIFAITQKFAKLLKTRVRIKSEKIHVIYNGIFFHSDSQIPAKYEHPYFNIINVARAEKVKGQALMLKALKRLDDDHIRLHIAGDGAELDALKKLAQKLDLSPQVAFHGFLSKKELEQLYQITDLAVLTSFSESFPLVLLEASDNLVPILSTDVGDIKMMIPDFEHGFIAKIGNVESIANAIEEAVNKPKKELDQIAVNEKRYLESHFSIKNQLQSIEKVYNLIIK